jgi:translation elongation factor P/translation initiation factor 5A
MKVAINDSSNYEQFQISDRDFYIINTNNSSICNLIRIGNVLQMDNAVYKIIDVSTTEATLELYSTEDNDLYTTEDNDNVTQIIIPQEQFTYLRNLIVEYNFS